MTSGFVSWRYWRAILRRRSRLSTWAANEPVVALVTSLSSTRPVDLPASRAISSKDVRRSPSGPTPVWPLRVLTPVAIAVAPAAESVIAEPLAWVSIEPGDLKRVHRLGGLEPVAGELRRGTVPVAHAVADQDDHAGPGRGGRLGRGGAAREQQRGHETGDQPTERPNRLLFNKSTKGQHDS